MSTWIDFKELRMKLRFLEVLEHYSIEVTVKGQRATGFCPLPTHRGQRRSPSFSVNLVRGIWQCFGCQAKGNVLDFACRMEGFNPNNPKELRQAALKIRETFHLERTAGQEAPARAARQSTEKPNLATQPVLINEPIDFELRTLDPGHPYLKERGFTEETIRHFGLGYCNRGMLKGRFAIPLHDPQGRLVGYAGRITKDEMIGPKCPKYLFPGERERKGVKVEFRKSLLLYNAHRIKTPVDHLFVVEGFAATWWLWQAKYVNTVALMGASCSQKQANLIVDLVKPDGRIWLMPDGDEAAIRCAKSVFEQVSPHRFIRWVPLANGTQPTDVPADEFDTLFVS
jgi:DNA primase